MVRACAILAVTLTAVPAAAEDVLSPYAAVTLEEAWDSNVLGSRGDDAVTRLTPRLGLLREGERLRLGLDYRLGLHTYAAGTADSSVNHRAAAWSRFAIDRRFDLDTTFLVIDADDPIVLERPGLAVPPGGIFEAQGMAKLATRITRRWSASTSYGYRTSRFELAGGPMPLAWNGDEHRADVRAAWRATRRLDTTFAARGQVFLSEGDEVAVAPMTGLAWRATRTLRLSAESGPVVYVASTADGAAQLSYLADGRAVWQGRRLRGALVLQRELYGGTGAPTAIWAEQASLSLGYRLGEATLARIVGGLGRQGQAPNGPADASTLTGRAEVRIALGHQLRLDLYAEQRSQDTEGGVAFGDVHRTVAGVRLTGALGASLDDLSEVP